MWISSSKYSPIPPSVSFQSYQSRLELIWFKQGPFFIFWVPMFYRSQGFTWDSPAVVVPSVYFVVLCVFCKSEQTHLRLINFNNFFSPGTLRYFSKVWRNGIASITLPRLDWGEQIVLIAGGTWNLEPIIVFHSIIIADLRRIWDRTDSRPDFGGSECPCRGPRHQRFRRHCKLYDFPSRFTGYFLHVLLDDITYFQCDVSKWDEVEETSQKIIEEAGS